MINIAWVLHLAAWSIVFPVLCLTTIQSYRKNDPQEGFSVSAFLVFVLALALQLSVQSIPADVRLDVALAGLQGEAGHRLSAINRLAWEAASFFSRLLRVFSVWDGEIALHALAGSLSVLAVYRFTLREYENRATAFGAALLVACFPPVIRFSASDSPASLTLLFTALALDFVSLAAKSGEARMLFIAAGWLAALVEVRSEGIGFALGSLIFLAPRWKSLARIRTKALVAAGLIAVLLAGHRFAITAWTARTTDLMPPLNPLVVTRAFMRLPDNNFTGSLWLALCLAGLTFHAAVDPKVLACRLSGLYVGTYMLVCLSNLSSGQTGNIHYWFPALVLVAVPFASGLVSLIARMPKPLSKWPRGTLLVVVLAAPGRTWETVRTRWATQEELHFVLKELPKIPDGCRILTRKPVFMPGALEVGPSFSLLSRRAHNWKFLDPSDPAEGDFISAAPCVVYYRGGRCATRGRPAFGDEPIPDDCAKLESRWQMVPLAESRVGGAPLVAESYRTNPYPVGFFRVSATK